MSNDRSHTDKRTQAFLQLSEVTERESGMYWNTCIVKWTSHDLKFENLNVCCEDIKMYQYFYDKAVIDIEPGETAYMHKHTWLYSDGKVL